MPPLDPALGLTGALTALQAQPPLNAAPQPRSDGSEDLARAARSLESVQGNVAGQTQAIQQMTMATQQQSANLQMMINQLGTQITGLVQAMGQMSMSLGTNQAMAAMPPPMPMPPMGGGGMNWGGMAMGAGSMALGAGAMGLRAAHAVGRPLGRAGDFLAAPFFGTPVGAPAPGMIAPGLSPDVGAFRSGIMATGLGITPEMMRTAGAGQLQELAQERMQRRVGDIGLGVLGGAARLGTSLGADWLGTSVMAPALGFGTGMGGALAGTALGMPVAALAGAAINETMGQTAAIRGGGEQFARNAFRFMGPSALGYGQTRRPGTNQRLGVGQAMNRMAVEDLVYNNQDIQDIFAGLTQQDLMRGISSSDDVVQRMRQTKETFRLIGRRLGQGIREAADTMGSLQEVGFDPGGLRMRAAIFGAGSVMGMAPGQAMQRATAMGQQYAGQGLGREMTMMGLQSLQMGQSAIQTGALGNIGIAALGGREGVGQTMQGVMGSFLQSQMGRAMLLQGGGMGGGGVFDVMRRAGIRANRDVNRVIDIELGGEQQARDFLQDPRAMADMMRMVMSVAREIRSGDPRISNDNAMRLSLKNLTGIRDGAQLTAILDIMKNAPVAKRQEQVQMGFQMADELSSQNAEQLALMARAQRGWQRTFAPVAEGLSNVSGDIESGVGRLATRAHRRLTGAQVTPLGFEFDVDAFSEITDRARGKDVYKVQTPPPEPTLGTGEFAQEEYDRKMNERNRILLRDRGVEAQKLIHEAKPTPARQRAIEKKVRDGLAGVVIGDRVRDLVSVYEDPGSDNGDKKLAVEKMLDVVSRGRYKDASNEDKKAYQEALRKQFGINVGAALIGEALPPDSRENIEDIQNEVASILSLDKPEQAQAFASPEIVAVLEAMQKGDDEGLAEAKQRAIDAKYGAQVEAIEKMQREEFNTSNYAFTAPATAIAAFTGSKTAGAILGGAVGTGLTALSHITGIGGTTAEERTARLSQLLGGGKGQLGGMLRKEGTRTRTRTAGQRMAGLVNQLGTQGDLASRLGSDRAGVAGIALGDVIPTLTSEEINKIGKMEGGEGIADILRTMKDVWSDQKIEDDERGRLAKIMNLNLEREADRKKMDDIVKNVTEKGNMGAAVTQAIAGAHTHGASWLQGAGGLTQEQVDKMSTSMGQLAITSMVVTDMLKEWNAWKAKL